MQPPSRPAPAISPQTIRRLVAGIAVLVAVLYFTGRLDHLLYPVGLNLNECAKNGYGSVYCGGELDEYRESVSEPLERSQREAQESLREFETEGLYGR